MKQSVRHVKTVKTPLCVLSIAMLAFAAFARTSLPDGYCELEYIQSTGKQIIDTGYKMNPLSKIAVDFQLTSAVAQDRIFGNDSVQTVFRTSFYANANKIFAFSCGDTFSGTTFTTADTKRHQAVLDAANKKTAYQLTTDGVTTTKENKLAVTQTAPYSETLFARFTSDWSNVSNGSKMKLYSCQMYESEEPVREFVPCKRLADEVIGLYDCIGQQFYTNAAPGETQPFAAGPVVPLISVSEVPDQTATGYELTPEPVVTQVYGEALTEDVDYALTYEDNVIAGTGRIVATPLTAKAGYGTVVREFKILNPNPIKADQYASDGILGHWEAIENAGLNLPHDPAAVDWVDLAGGEAFHRNSSYGSWANGKAFYCNGNGIAATRMTSQMGIVTADIALRRDSADTAKATAWLSGQRTGGSSAFYYFYNGTLNFINGTGLAFAAKEDATVSAVYSLDSDQCATSVRAVYRDGVAVKASKSTDYISAGGDSCTIGARNASDLRPFTGNIYAIRLYSRELTAEEVRKNADLDAVRYFGAPLLIAGEIPTQTYDGVHPCEPKVHVTNVVTRAELVEGTDYRVVYRDNAASGTATASVYGLGTLVGYGNEQSFIVVSKVFETPGELDDVCTVAYSPASAALPVFSGSIKTFGDGEVHIVRLLMGTDPEKLTEAASVEVTAEGPFSVSAKWCDYGLPVYYRFVYETSDGEESYYSDTSNSSEPSPDYKATYTWKGGAEADWQDGDSWTISDATVSNPKPYPFSGTRHTVIFPAKANATVRLKGGEACLYIQSNKGASFRLQGVGDEPVPFTAGLIRWSGYANVTCVCDRVAVRLTNVSGSATSGAERFGTGSLLRFENGGSISVIDVNSYGVNFSSNPNYAVEVDGGAYDYRPSSKAATYPSMKFSGQSRVLVRDGLMRANIDVSLCNAATGPSAWTFEGAAPRLVALSNFGVTGAAGSTLTFKPGATGFAAPVISVSNKVAFAAGSYDKGPVTVSVPKDAGIWGTSPKQDIVLISAPKGINTNVIEFAQMPRPSGSFVYLPEGAENPTSLVFRYRPRGTVLILK